MVQVENESGSWGSVRDYSPQAEKLFAGPVPERLLRPEILRTLIGTANQTNASATANVSATTNGPITTNASTNSATPAGSWKQIFGARADEYFHAWYIASYIGAVAAAGKAEYPLPLYTNAALRDPLTNPSADSYESGGPTDNTIPIWKAAAPAIDLLAPDIYLDKTNEIEKVIQLYTRPDNPLFIPEIGLSHDRAKYFYSMLAAGGIGFSPFGIDDNGAGESADEMVLRLAPFAENYEPTTALMPQLAKWAFEGNIKAVIEPDNHDQQIIDLGSWQAIVNFGIGERIQLKPNPAGDGRLMIIQLNENKFLLIGEKCHVVFRPAGKNTGKPWQYGTVEEGNFVKGEFKRLRILNGDETDWGGPHLGQHPTLLQATLIAR
jgi:hypothetical protein